MYLTVGCFVFQAEDGIRDLVRSRGLGDVYKRQVFDDSVLADDQKGREQTFAEPEVDDLQDTACPSCQGSRPVSYTHLTLPTSDLV